MMLLLISRHSRHSRHSKRPPLRWANSNTRAPFGPQKLQFNNNTNSNYCTTHVVHEQPNQIVGDNEILWPRKSQLVK